MFKKILIGLAAVIVAFVVVVALQPAEFAVTRSASMNAAPSVIFEQVNDLRKWQEFSPWAKLDPNAKVTFSGPPTGVGAVFAWAGNENIGEGRMTITESSPDRHVRYRLDFVKPFEGTNDSALAFEPRGSQTLVTWSMSGKNNFLFKAVGLFIDCDEMVGAQFEVGLENLRKIVEAPRSGTGAP